MKNQNHSKAKKIIGFSIISFLIISCSAYSTIEHDKHAGINGSFEKEKNGLAVNWLFYSPKDLPNSSFEILLDKKVYKEGKQSLHFDIEHCSAQGGKKSPGFSNEFFDAGKFKGPANYKISFWAINKGSKFRLSAGSVDAFTGDMHQLIESEEEFSDWQYFEHTVNVKENQHLRIEFNLLKAGQFWVDEIKIEQQD